MSGQTIKDLVPMVMGFTMLIYWVIQCRNSHTDNTKPPEANDTLVVSHVEPTEDTVAVDTFKPSFSKRLEVFAKDK
jgi:hypothetical protein